VGNEKRYPYYGFQKPNERGEQPTAESATWKSARVCSLSYFPVQSRWNCIRIPPGEGEMQITCAAESDGCTELFPMWGKC
jgi:hypothetical protein